MSTSDLSDIAIILMNKLKGVMCGSDAGVLGRVQSIINEWNDALDRKVIIKQRISLEQQQELTELLMETPILNEEVTRKNISAALDILLFNK